MRAILPLLRSHALISPFDAQRPLKAMFKAYGTRLSITDQRRPVWYPGRRKLGGDSRRRSSAPARDQKASTSADSQPTLVISASSARRLERLERLTQKFLGQLLLESATLANSEQEVDCRDDFFEEGISFTKRPRCVVSLYSL